MAALNLFPARVAFVNPDGTLTNEAYRALQMVFERVGGALGDSGADVFGQVFGSASDATSIMQTDVVQPVNAPTTVNAETVQPANFGTDYYGDVVQYLAPDLQFADVVQPPSKDREAGIFTTLDVSGNASIGGSLKLAAGTVALPSLYLSTDTTTGFYRIGANNNGYAVAGVKVLDLLATGLAVTGGLSATQAITLTGTPPSAGAGVRYLSGNSTTTNFFFNVPTGGKHQFAVQDSEVVVITALGVGVTGTLASTGGIGINGKPPVVNVPAPTAAGTTYTTTEQALLNDIRTRLINFGIYT